MVVDAFDRRGEASGCSDGKALGAVLQTSEARAPDRLSTATAGGRLSALHTGRFLVLSLRGAGASFSINVNRTLQREPVGRGRIDSQPWQTRSRARRGRD